jgi:RNA polymerase sigma factor (sigma-70 family)
LLRRYQRLLYAIPLRCGLSEDEAADVFQTVCLKLLENLEKLQDERHLTGWLITTTKRESWRIYELRRRLEGHAGETDMLDESVLGSLPDPEPLPEQELVRLAEAQLVRQALGELNERCRTLLTLLFHSDPPLTYEAIARELNVSVGAIGPTRARCLQRLRKVLERMGF